MVVWGRGGGPGHASCAGEFGVRGSLVCVVGAWGGGVPGMDVVQVAGGRRVVGWI